MKRLILSAILFLGITATGFSQERPQRVQKSPEERAQKMTDALDQKLSLSATQKSEIYKINLERAKAAGDFRKGRKEAGSQKRDNFKASDDKILSVLTADQKVTYNEWKAQRADKFKNHRGTRKPGSRNK